MEYPRCTCEGDHVGRGGGPKVYICKDWTSPRGEGKIINPAGDVIILRFPLGWRGGANVGNYFTLKRVSSYNYRRHYQPPENIFENYFGKGEGGKECRGYDL